MYSSFDITTWNAPRSFPFVKINKSTNKQIQKKKKERRKKKERILLVFQSG